MNKKLMEIITEIENEHMTSNKHRNRMISSILIEFAERLEKEFRLIPCNSKNGE